MARPVRPILLCTAGVLIVAFAVAGHGDMGVVAYFILPALAGVVAAWFLSAAPKSAPATPTCSFCGKTHLEVQKLVAGPNCMICDECVGLSKEVILEHDDGASSVLDVAAGELERVLAHRGRLAFAESDRIVRAWLTLDPSPAACRRAAAAAQRLDNLHTAIAALDGLAPEDRRAWDELDRAAMHLTSGELDEAADRLEAVRERNDLSETEEAVLALHEATLLGLEPETGPEGLRQSCELADEALDQLDQLELDPGYRTLRAEGHRARARALMRLGQGAAALEAAREAVAHFASAQSHALLADALEANGDDEAAATSRREALKLAHPESLLAQQLTPTSAGPFR